MEDLRKELKIESLKDWIARLKKRKGMEKMIERTEKKLKELEG